MEIPVGLGLGISALTSGLGAIMQGQQSSASANAQAQAMNYQAKVDENNAQTARDQAAVREEQQRRRFAALEGQAMAGIAQSGTGFDGSNLDMLKQNAVNNELDALTIRYEGQTKANSFDAQSNLDRYNSSIYSMNAGNAATSGFVNAGSNLLSGFSRYALYSGLLSSGAQKAGIA